MHAVHKDLSMANRSITLIAALFQEAFIQTPIGDAVLHYMPRLSAPLVRLKKFSFIRNYFRNTFWFKFLRLPICLNSAGLQA